MDKKQFSMLCKSSHPHSLLPGLIRANDMWLCPGLSAIQGDTDSPLQMGQLSLTGCLIKLSGQAMWGWLSLLGFSCLWSPQSKRFSPAGYFWVSASACEPWQLDVPRGDVRCPIDSGELPLFLPERIKIGSSIWAFRWWRDPALLSGWPGLSGLESG